jgi:dsRNA-specific ribonuclease
LSSREIKNGELNSNNKRPLGISKQNRPIKKFKDKTNKKVKIPRLNENANPSQLLNELRPGLEYIFEQDASNKIEIRYICKVSVDGIVYTSNGSSKKEAKRSCADHILSILFPDRYRKKVTNEEELCIKKKVDRIPKILNLASIKTKSAAQLLNELDPVLARSGRYTNEAIVNNDKIFIFEIDIKVKQNVVQGTGKNKKIAKNEASKLAIKELYNIDIDQVLIKETIEPQISNTTQPIPTLTSSSLDNNHFIQFQAQQYYDLDQSETFF